VNGLTEKLYSIKNSHFSRVLSTSDTSFASLSFSNSSLICLLLKASEWISHPLKSNHSSSHILLQAFLFKELITYIDEEFVVFSKVFRVS